MITASKLILGTVQLGLDYGINNTAGKPAANTAFKILDTAREKEIFLLDTAEAYGNAIQIIGDYQLQSGYNFQVISKFKFTVGDDLLQNLINTLKVLHTNQIYAYLLHDPRHLDEAALPDQFEILKQKQLIRYSGVSVYTNQQFEKAIETQCIDIIQIPYNLLDNNYQRATLIQQAKKKGKFIHTRSVFLQGLFFMDAIKLPVKLLPLKKYIIQVQQLSNEFQISNESMALNYVLNNSLIDGVLIGVDSAEQLLKNIHALKENIPAALIEKINAIHVAETTLLNPSNWN
jgi:uncharacterized protein